MSLLNPKKLFLINSAFLQEDKKLSYDSVFFLNILHIVFLPSTSSNGIFKRQYELLKSKAAKFELIMNGDHYRNMAKVALDKQLIKTQKDDVSVGYKTVMLDKSREENMLKDKNFMDLSIIMQIINYSSKLNNDNINTFDKKKCVYVIGVIADEFLISSEKDTYKYYVKEPTNFIQRYLNFNSRNCISDFNNINIFVTKEYISSALSQNQFPLPKNFMVKLNYDSLNIVQLKESQNLHKIIVVDMLIYWKELISKVAKIMIQDSDFFKNSMDTLHSTLRGYAEATEKWQGANETNFQYPITETQIKQVLNIETHLAKKIVFILQYLIKYNNINIQKKDIIRAWKQHIKISTNGTTNLNSKITYFENMFGFKNQKDLILTYFTEFESSSINSFKQFFLAFPQLLTWEILFGWRYYTDLITVISREEIKYHKKFIKSISRNAGLKIDVVGSYRRGVGSDVNKITILLFSPDMNNKGLLKSKLENLIKILIEVGYIDFILSGETSSTFDLMKNQRKYLLDCVKDNFTSDVGKFDNLKVEKRNKRFGYNCIVGASLNGAWFRTSGNSFDNDVPNGIFIGPASKLKREDEIFNLKSAKKKICRLIDLTVAPYSEMGYKRLFLTGNYNFIRSVETYCEKNGFKLNETQLFDINRNKLVVLNNSSESDLLSFLGLEKFLNPMHRQFESFVDLSQKHSVPARSN